MTDIDIPQELPIPVERPPQRTYGVVDWLRANLFGSVFNTILTLIALYFLAVVIPPLVRWAFVDAVWSAPNGQACRGAGACWAFIGEKLRFILFGRFPYDQQWRPLGVVVIFVAMILASCDRRLWGRRLMLLWLGGFIAAGVLMWGGILGMRYVETGLWSGLPLTLILAVVGLPFALPVAILLALGRRSRLPAVRAVSVAYIELVRGVPLITVLFMASVVLPLFLPSGVTIDKLLRAGIAFVLFAAAYIAEVIRGGLQAIPKGQYEGAMSLGLNYWKMNALIILPQALRISIPGIVNSFIGLFMDTTLVLIVGQIELLGMAQSSARDPNWLGTINTALAFVSVVYFTFCFSMSRYSQYLERKLHRGHKR